MSVLTELKTEYHEREARAVRQALIRAEWRLTQAAAVLDTSLSSLCRALRRHPDLDAERRVARGLDEAV